MDLSGLNSASLRCDYNPMTKLVLVNGSITMVANPEAGGKVRITASNSEGRVNVVATANKGYTFYDWTISANGEDRNMAAPATTSINIKNNIIATVTANFAGDPAN